MYLAGLQKLTLLDYPGEVACTVFTQGCNLRCPFCHNPELVLHGKASEEVVLCSDDSGESFGPGLKEEPSGPGLKEESFGPGLMKEEDFFDYLDHRRGKLSGVAVSGGEPTLQGDLPDFLARIREMGFLVKLDTNGQKPDVLRRILSEGLVDYVAMDVKNSPGNYSVTCGRVTELADDMASPGRLWENALESILLLEEGRTAYEFRTTVVSGLHTEADIVEMAGILAGARAWYLQQFVKGKELVGDYFPGGLFPKMASPSAVEMERFREAALKIMPNVYLRGV